MRMKKAVLALLAGGLLLPAAGFADRLNNSFRTLDKTNAADNEACIVADGPFFGVGGDVHAVSGNCDVDIFYFSDLPNSASASAITGSKTSGTAKVSQGIFTDITITVDDTGGSCASGTYEGSASSEKCKASGSMKGTVGSPDTVDSSKVSLSCDLGDAGANLSPVPSTNTLSTITTAFGSRKDVKIDSKGKLSIKHDGATATPSGFCGF